MNKLQSLPAAMQELAKAIALRLAEEGARMAIMGTNAEQGWSS